MPDRGPVRRVAVTGLGIISCCGSDPEEFFAGICAPAGPGDRHVTGYDPSVFFDTKEERQTDRFAQFAIATAQMALEDAKGPGGDPRRTGVIYATGIGGLETLQAQIGVLVERGPRRVSPRLVPMIMGNAGAAGISLRFGFQGPCETVVTACASATHAIANAARLVAYGKADAMVCGGSEAVITPVEDRPPIGTTAFSNMTALSTSGWSRPFDVRRDGFVIAEGAAALILENLEHAQARGARIYAEVLGSASNADAHHITAPAPDGSGARTCMELAMEDAGITTADVVHINGHGTSTPVGDLAEAKAIVDLFGTPGPPVTSIKGVTGHALGASGALEACSVVLSLTHGVIPPTVGLEQQDPEIEIDVVTGDPRPFTPGPVLSNSFGFGGHNGCLVIGPAPN